LEKTHKEKIYINPQTGQATSIEIPWFGRLKTNVPALVLFFFGLLLLGYPIYQSSVVTAHPKKVAITGPVQSGFPVTVYAISAIDVLQAARGFYAGSAPLAGE
jgi:hypothetical protein